MLLSWSFLDGGRTKTDGSHVHTRDLRVRTRADEGREKDVPVSTGTDRRVWGTLLVPEVTSG